MSVKIIIVDDHDLIRDGIRCVLGKRPDFAVIGEGQNGRDAIRLATGLFPDIVLMDIYMPRMNGIEATSKLRDGGCKSKVIALSCCTDRKSISRVLAAGASAFVSKGWPTYELFRAITTVYANQPYHFPAAKAIVHVCDQAHIPNAGKLSVRELQTLQLVASGKSSNEIAQMLNVCLKTVEAHRHMLRRKTGRSSVADLTHYAIEEGIVQSKFHRT